MVDGLRSKAHPELRIATHYSTDWLDGTSLSLRGMNQPMSVAWRRGSVLIALPHKHYEVIALTASR
jgi:hypothetical protein